MVQPDEVRALRHAGRGLGPDMDETLIASYLSRQPALPARPQFGPNQALELARRHCCGRDSCQHWCWASPLGESPGDFPTVCLEHAQMLLNVTARNVDTAIKDLAPPMPEVLAMLPGLQAGEVCNIRTEPPAGEAVLE